MQIPIQLKRDQFFFSSLNSAFNKKSYRYTAPTSSPVNRNTDHTVSSMFHSNSTSNKYHVSSSIIFSSYVHFSTDSRTSTSIPHFNCTARFASCVYLSETAHFTLSASHKQSHTSVTGRRTLSRLNLSISH